MSERIRDAWIGVGLRPWTVANSEAQEQQPNELGEAIGSTVISYAVVSEETTVAIDDQTPRSWDLHKSGY